MKSLSLALLIGCSVPSSFGPFGCSGEPFTDEPAAATPEAGPIVHETGPIVHDAVSSELSSELDAANLAVDGRRPIDGCTAAGDCAGPCAGLEPTCVNYSRGNFCACACAGSAAERAACSSVCAAVPWATCGTCDSNVEGRIGICGCGKDRDGGACAASTCGRNVDCPSLFCADGWCQP